MTRAFTSALLLFLLSACGETTGGFVEIPFAGQGTAAQSFTKDGWEVTLSDATLGFGPIYFCATESALSSRCEVAILEYLEGSKLDGLDPSSQPIGSLYGTTGTVRTAFFDYGIVWLLTKPLPEALAGVPEGPAVVRSESSSYVPKGHSAQFAGTASCVAEPATCCPGAASCPTSFAFEANVDVLVANPGTPAVNGVRTSQEITSEPRTLTVTFDPNAWWQSIDFARLAALDDGTGSVLLEPDDPDYSALVIAMTANELPQLTWTVAETEP
ncbi:MAG: hypothetical protein HKP36_01785 [Myxococcales bacterium]|nr:hypothetical protein [Deltaproteobacteria bacterium]NNK43026.1 hypothetical protein [Myxococcales bacterium]NNL23160.1 hypothetical protein [Myxococcales bacterium]RZV50214.1 MAG: hypothetical protein EX268_17525 [Deltaproteobacteria bacterium]